MNHESFLWGFMEVSFLSPASFKKYHLSDLEGKSLLSSIDKGKKLKDLNAFSFNKNELKNHHKVAQNGIQKSSSFLDSLLPSKDIIKLKALSLESKIMTAKDLLQAQFLVHQVALKLELASKIADTATHTIKKFQSNQ
jgi:hypothetical protein